MGIDITAVLSERVSLGLGLAYGSGVVLMADSAYNTPNQSSPAMSALGGLIYGVLGALVILPLIAVLTYRLGLRRSVLSGPEGYALAGLVTVVGAVVGFMLGATWSPSV